MHSRHQFIQIVRLQDAIVCSRGKGLYLCEQAYVFGYHNHRSIIAATPKVRAKSEFEIPVWRLNSQDDNVESTQLRFLQRAGNIFCDIDDMVMSGEGVRQH